MRRGWCTLTTLMGSVLSQWRRIAGTMKNDENMRARDMPVSAAGKRSCKLALASASTRRGLFRVSPVYKVWSIPVVDLVGVSSPSGPSASVEGPCAYGPNELSPFTCSLGMPAIRLSFQSALHLRTLKSSISLSACSPTSSHSLNGLY